MVFEKIRDWQRYLENVMGVDFEIDGKDSVYNLLKKSPQNDEFDTKDVFTLEFMSAVLDDIDKLSESINEYPGSFSFADPFDDLTNWVVVSGSPFVSGGKLIMVSGDEVSRIPTINGDKISIKMQSSDVSQTPACRYFVDASAATQIIEIKIDDSKLKFNNGADFDLQAVVNDTEYTVEIYFDFTSKTMDIYVDTVLKYANVTFETECEKVYQFRIKGENTGGSSFSDDFSGDLGAWTLNGSWTIEGQRARTPQFSAGWMYATHGQDLSKPASYVTWKMEESNTATSTYGVGMVSTFTWAFRASFITGVLVMNGGPVLANPANNDQEYTILVNNIDLTNFKYDVYLDGQLKGSGVSFENNVNPDRFYASQGSPSATGRFLDDVIVASPNVAMYDDYLNEFIGTHPPVITPANGIYKDKHREKHWWTVVWEVWN